MKYTLEVEISGESGEKDCWECPCLHYDIEFGTEYCAGQRKEPEHPKCIKTCPLKAVQNGKE